MAKKIKQRFAKAWLSASMRNRRIADCELVTFDVFDTLLVRRTIQPSDVSVLWARKAVNTGIVTLSWKRLAETRLEVERRLKPPKGVDPDASLDQIYRELASELELTEVAREALMGLEMDLELGLLECNPVEVNVLLKLRNNGTLIGFLSDMYLPREVVQRALQDKGLLQTDDLLLVSSEAGASKRTGALFDLAARLANVRPEKACHRGNSTKWDVIPALKRGWNVVHTPSGNPTSAEKAFGRWAKETNGMAGLIAGAARLGRLRAQERHGMDDPITAVAANIVAPAIIAYCLWVLREASREGVDRIFFLAREGQILFETCQLLVQELPAAPALVYLGASRSALNPSGLFALDSSNIAWLMGQAKNRPLSELLGRLGLASDTDELIQASGGLFSSETDIFTVERAGVLIEAVKQTSAGVTLLKAAERKRSTVIPYLRQTGFLDDCKVALCDTNGIGSQIQVLTNIRLAHELTKPLGFHVARDTEPVIAEYGDLAGVDAAEIRGWMYDAVRDGEQTEKKWVFWETFCTADHGRVVGYQSDSGQGTISPTFGPPPHAQEKWGRSRVRETILEAAAAVHLYMPEAELDANLRPAVQELLDRFWKNPSREEARAWAGFPFMSGIEDEVQKTLAEPLRLREALLPKWMINRSRGPRWGAGCIAISPVGVRLLMRFRREVRGLFGGARPP